VREGGREEGGGRREGGRGRKGGEKEEGRREGGRRREREGGREEGRRAVNSPGNYTTSSCAINLIPRLISSYQRAWVQDYCAMG